MSTIERVKEYFRNRKHRKLNPYCDVVFRNGIRVWKKEIKSGDTAEICMDCHLAIIQIPPSYPFFHFPSKDLK